MNIQTNSSHAASKASVSATCPHGSMPGSCPSCNGGGGGGGGARRATAGLMGWGEAYSVWKSIQNAKTQSEASLRALAASREQHTQDAEKTAHRSELQALLARFSQSSVPFVATIAQNLATLPARLNQLTSKLQSFFTTPQQQITQSIARLISAVSDKIATLLGEVKTRLNDILQQGAEAIKSLIAQFQWGEKLNQIQAMLSKLFRQSSPKQVFRTLTQSLKQSLKSAFSKVLSWFSFTPASEAPEEEVSLESFASIPKNFQA